MKRIIWWIKILGYCTFTRDGRATMKLFDELKETEPNYCYKNRMEYYRECVNLGVKHS